MSNSVLIKIIPLAMGDTIGAMPVIEKYRQDTGYNVFVYCNLSFQFLFKNSYPNINFIKEYNGLVVNHTIELYYDFKTPLQTGFAKQLGYTDWDYIRPVVDVQDYKNPFVKGEYVSMSIHSTSQLKYWNHPSGKSVQRVSPNWHMMGNFISKHGIKSVIVDKYELFGNSPYFNGIPPTMKSKIGKSMEYVMNVIYHSKFYIGPSSGLAWLAHAMGKSVVMISNFTEDWNEFDLSSNDYIRITNKSVCHGCWNRIGIDFEFNAGDWYWCPKFKDTNRQFECHTSITPEMVYEQIKHWL